MSGIVLRWGVPALVTVVGGTSLAISATSTDMNRDLIARATSVLTSEEFGWASVSFDGRDAIVSGTATTQQMIDDVSSQLGRVHGVRSVRSAIVLAEYVSPFPFEASIRDGAISLRGGVPDETAHAEIALMTGSADDSLRLLSGAPRRQAWQSAVEYGLAHLREFDEGHFSLADLEISISGRASSVESFDALTVLGSEPPPAGIKIASRTIEPALASPFEWHASFDGTNLVVSGFTPTTEFVERLRTAGAGGRPVSTSLVLASGAPFDFEAKALLLLENLVRLEEGRADISDSTVTLSGAPPDQTTVDSIRLALSPTGASLELAPPRVAAYTFSAMRTNGTLSLDGFVPDEATRARLSQGGIETAGLELARGAPDRFESGVEFGLAMLARMSEGRFTIENTALAVEGRAATVADFTEIETTLALGAPQGLILASAAVKPPLANPFVWSAQKTEEGRVRISGFVPSKKARDALHAIVPGLEEDTSTIADGNPENFETEAATALGVLPLLKSARIEYDGSHWIMTGSVDTPQAGLTAEQAFAATGLRQAGWSFALDLPDPAARAPLPIIDPYVWRAQKNGDGAVTIAGFVPTDGLKRILANRAGPGTVDNSSLGAGYPADFIAGTLAAIDALLELEEGAVGFDGRTWSLSGQVATGEDRLKLEGTLLAALDTRDWRISIQALDAPPVVAPYVWSATKAADGRVSLAGHVTTEELKRFVAVRAGSVATDTTTIASGEPAGFVADILAGLEALSHLSMGTVKYENGGWTLAGVPRTAADADLALAALGTAGTGGAGWQRSLSDPLERSVAVAEPAPEAQPVVEPAPAAEIAAAEQPATVTTEEVAAVEPAPAVEPTPAVEVAPTVEPAPATEVASVPEAEPLPETPPVARDFVFSATKPFNGTIALEGAVPADAARRFFGVIAGGVATDAMTINRTLPETFIPAADAGIRLLSSLEDGEFGLEGNSWVLSGRVETEAQRDAVLETLAALPAAADWQTNITLLPPIDVCRRHVTAFASRNAILFKSGSASLADESFPAIDELAGYLGACPDASVHIEGHTDADGDAELNLALSVARAEAVVNALIERGIGYERLYAVGYGESLPIENNDTNAGKRANRRIAFTILDEQ